MFCKYRNFFAFFLPAEAKMRIVNLPKKEMLFQVYLVTLRSFLKSNQKIK